ncbi:MAG TPA: hypothetical protein ENJ00_01535 [Phycisphaerales bacterium]|nr:hypothetical protein [Phycisphaerales bacterium]
MLKVLGVAAGVIGATYAQTQESLHFTYLWHLEQPIYWPDQKLGSPDQYEFAWDSILRTDGGAAHPENNLRDIFGKPDRVAVYQWRIRDAIGDISWASEAGAQVSYSGGLIQNIQSLGSNNQLGYSPSWNTVIQQARGWRTVGQSKPRLDMVIFPFHHALMPLISESAQRKEIQAYKSVYASTWGSSAPMSLGFFPPEMAFSERLIKVLDEEGIEWSIVSAEKISRANVDYPVVLGSGGVNCDPPNRADQVNPGAQSYYRVQISRGCAPAEAYPQALTPQRAQYVNPATGQVHEIVVIPASQSISWEDGFNPIGTQHFDAIQQSAGTTSRPMLITLAHDGDNAYGGGYSYYREATPNLVSQAEASGYHATVIEEYLADHPVPANAIVHVEDGAWVNADGDFGSPWFLNWNYPPVNAQGQVDIENGWAEDVRNWAVITAAQNHVDTAEEIATRQGSAVRIDKVVQPDGTATQAELAWHYFLGSLNSGYMYYGTAVDMEVKPTIACNEALEHADAVIVMGDDRTPPAVWIPQRWPWNPGSTNFGAPFGYQAIEMPTDMTVWTFVHDVSGVQSVTLKYRVDSDGLNPMDDHANELYAEDLGIGPWQTMPMNARPFPAENVYNDPSIDFFEMPQQIATQYSARLTGLSDALVDYYVEATDTLGYTTRSPIQHVWIGDGSGSNPGGDRVSILPDPAIAGENVTISYDASGGPIASASAVYLHYGFDGWSTVISPDPAMTFDAATQEWQITAPVISTASSLDLVFNDGTNNWDNNNGQDWHFQVDGSQPPVFSIDGSLDASATLIGTNAGISLWAGLDGEQLYVAATPANSGRDHFIFVNAMTGSPVASPWAKAGTVDGWVAFLADEADNGFSGWFDADGFATQAQGGVLEGLIDLIAEFGVLPTTIRLAVGAYDTPDGGSLLAQVPAGNGDGNIDEVEWFSVELCSLLQAGCDCVADVNGDGSLTASDFTAWIAAFNTSASECDQNGDGNCDQTDFTAWIVNFNAGCG